MRPSSFGAASTELFAKLLGPASLPANELNAFAEAIQQRHANAVRCRRESFSDPANCLDGSAGLPFENGNVPWYRLGRRAIDADKRPSRFLAYALGNYYIQDGGSLLALAAARAETEELSTDVMVCDLCAAPGGKATALLEAIGDRGFLLANEPIRSRLAPLQFNLTRTGSDRYAISQHDPSDLANVLAGQFDLVLVDAPCSGQALVGRGKQSQSALSTKQVDHSAARQERILDAAVTLLKPGGKLVYSTCTFAHAENEQQMSRLIDTEKVRAAPILELQSYASTENATYRLWPHRHDCAGSFAASAIAIDGGDRSLNLANRSSEVRSRKNKRKKKERAASLPIDLSQWYAIQGDDFKWKNTDSVIYAWPSDAPHWVTDVATMGPEVAYRTSQTWKPSHAGALRRQGLFAAQQFADINAETAARFFRGESVGCQQNGWQVVRYDRKPVGWVKASNGTGKNQLPTAARFNFDLEY